MTRTEWNKTPYAKSTAKDPEGSITKLLQKYGVKDVMLANYTGENGRAAFGVRFVLKGRSYKVAFESLDTWNQVTEEERRTQVKRAVYHTLKALMETATVFATMEQVLFSFAEIPLASKTMFELANPAFDKIGPANIGLLMLGPKKEE